MSTHIHVCRQIGGEGEGEGFIVILSCRGVVIVVVILSCRGIVVVVVVHPHPCGVGKWKGRERGSMSSPSSGGGVTVVVVVVVVGPQAADDSGMMCLRCMVSSSLRNK